MTLAAFVAVIVALYTFAERTRSRGATAAATVVAAALVSLPIWRLGGPDAAAPLTAAICFAPALLGLYTGTRRDLIAGMRERAERAEREQHERVLRARSDERAQIAQDMHDVVTHRVSLMVLHATALEASEGRTRPRSAGGSARSGARRSKSSGRSSRSCAPATPRWPRSRASPTWPTWSRSPAAPACG